MAVGFSTTFQNHAGVLQNVIDALAPLPVRVLVTRGGSIDPGDLRAAENTVIVDAAPHTQVMKAATIAVTHGGHGTVMRALINRLPTLVIPHGRDQNDNAARIAHRGAGLMLPPSASVEAIRAACQQLLTDPHFAAAAKRLGDQVAADAAACTGADELETLAAAVCKNVLNGERMENARHLATYVKMVLERLDGIDDAAFLAAAWAFPAPAEAGESRS